jgi:lipid-binding SYLF domain-containing protein
MLRALFLTIILLSTVSCSSTNASRTAARNQLETDSRAALEELFRNSPGAKSLAQSAAGVLVFPSITQGSFVFGGQFGDGVLFKGGQVADFYRTMSASFGFQAGLQRFGYALIFVTQEDLNHLTRTGGFELGVGPAITIIDRGTDISTSTNRITNPGIFAFFFDQRGLMAGVRIQGTTITRRD